MAKNIVEKVVVIVPLYKNELTNHEEVSFNQCLNVLKDYPVVLVKPDSLVVDDMIDIDKITDIVNFNDEYFDGVFGYNRLMLSNAFYEKFSHYEYMLVYQLDAFVFSDQLKYWCNCGFDYIGASWLPEQDNTVGKLWYRIRAYFYIRLNLKKKNGRPARKKETFYQVGNGGFSLRKINSFLRCLERFPELVEKFKSEDDGSYHEDLFWSIEMNRKRGLISKPGYRRGLKFAIETAPALALKLNKGKLPFGCHAWDKYLDFWRPIFREYGYFV